MSNFSISADYFNQRVFGWEPVVEKWSVLRFLVTKKDNTRNMDLIAGTFYRIIHWGSESDSERKRGGVHLSCLDVVRSMEM